tara:strand:- start:2225 stop:2527 length:303 start_codon:yes stop_codon:yes gene_type:complete
MFITKLSSLKGQPYSKVWLEGPRLDIARFNHKEPYTVEYGAAVITLRRCAGDADKIRRVAGTLARPIIDLGNKTVARMFSGSTHVAVDFNDGVITIRADH